MIFDLKLFFSFFTYPFNLSNVSNDLPSKYFSVAPPPVVVFSNSNPNLFAAAIISPPANIVSLFLLFESYSNTFLVPNEDFLFQV